MRGELISYFDMCQQEHTSLQRGMNFRLNGAHSVILMSLRPNAPYHDRVEEDGSVLIYEGHDTPRSANTPDPKIIDQPMYSPSGALTENGKFFRAAKEYAEGKKDPDLVRVYEKIRQGIWADNGYFHLVDAWDENDGKRSVFKYKLIAVEGVQEDTAPTDTHAKEHKPSRIIPTPVKLEVWKRDKGKCQVCSATDELHFDHILPWSKGGTSLKAENIQLLCARHNLEKRDKIQ
jgi:hypothetical protein